MEGGGKSGGVGAGRGNIDDIHTGMRHHIEDTGLDIDRDIGLGRERDTRIVMNGHAATPQDRRKTTHEGGQSEAIHLRHDGVSGHEVMTGVEMRSKVFESTGRGAIPQVVIAIETSREIEIMDTGDES